LYNAPAASFNNAEHAKITAKNGSTLTLQRGYKSSAVSHASGSIIAQHVLGQGGNHPLNWSYNLSTACPKDGNGQVISTVMANFLKSNIKKDREGISRNVKVTGILFDVDFYFEIERKNSDVNNDLVVDHGITSAGFNMWGAGMDGFYTKVRNAFPNYVIIAGTKNSRGFGSLSGTQIEGWVGGFGGSPQYNEVDSLFGKYIFSLKHYSDGPLHTHVLNKQSTRQYPTHGHAPDNKPFRFGLSLALMGDGYYGQENTPTYPDPWYDEYAVDVRSGSSTYGKAVSGQSGNEVAVRSNLGWLGSPKGGFQRIYNDSDYSKSKSLISNSEFESNVGDWTGDSVSVSRDTSTKKDGSASLKISAMNTFKSDAYLARADGPSAYMVKDREYTLAFSIKSSAVREVFAQVGNQRQRFLTGPKWQRRIMTIKPNRTGDAQIRFLVGRENSAVWIDSVYLFQGNVNVFKREFDQGVVVVNGSPSSKTIDLGKAYQRILGTQDGVNNGTATSRVTLPAYDGLILVNAPGSGGGSGGGNTGGGNTGGGTTGNTPSLALETTLNETSVASPGQTLSPGAAASWKYSVKNDGDTEVNNVRVYIRQKAPSLGDWQEVCILGEMSAGATKSCRVEGVAEQGNHNILVNVRGVIDSGEVIQDAMNAYYSESTGGNSGGGSTGTPALQLSTFITGKSLAKPGPILTTGATANWSYTLTNTGSAVLDNVQVSIRRKLPALESWVTACTIGKLQVGATASCSYSTQVADGVNKYLVTAQGKSGNDLAQDSSDAFYTGSSSGGSGGGGSTNASLHLQSLINGQSTDKPGPVLATGSRANWVYQVKNTGQAVLKDVRISARKKLPTLADWYDACVIGVIQPGETRSCSATSPVNAGTNKYLVSAKGTLSSGKGIEYAGQSFYSGN
ncbi:MAG: hypothetical protein V3V12_00820, partial [Gammaproteobacteria bacterium]